MATATHCCPPCPLHIAGHRSHIAQRAGFDLARPRAFLRMPRSPMRRRAIHPHHSQRLAQHRSPGVAGGIAQQASRASALMRHRARALRRFQHGSGNTGAEPACPPLECTRSRERLKVAGNRPSVRNTCWASHDVVAELVHAGHDGSAAAKGCGSPGPVGTGPRRTAGEQAAGLPPQASMVGQQSDPVYRPRARCARHTGGIAPRVLTRSGVIEAGLHRAAPVAPQAAGQRHRGYRPTRPPAAAPRSPATPAPASGTKPSNDLKLTSSALGAAL